MIVASVSPMTIPVTGAPTIGKVRPTMLATTATPTASQSPGELRNHERPSPAGREARACANLVLLDGRRWLLDVVVAVHWVDSRPCDRAPVVVNCR